MSDPPNYYDGLPSMSGQDWLSTSSNFDLGWISGLHKVADKSIARLFSGFTLKINEEDLLDIDLDMDKFTDEGLNPFIYAIVWLVLAVIFTLAGLIWCCCNKCCCCCRSSFKGRGDEFDNLENTDSNLNLAPTYSKRKQKKFSKPSSVGAIIVAVLMAIWLISLLLMLLHSFGANEKTKQGIDRIQPDLENALKDIIKYIEKTLEQLVYAFGDSYLTLDENVRGIGRACDETDHCDHVRNVVSNALGKTDKTLREDLKNLTDALEELRDASEDAKEEVDENYENVLEDVNNALYWFFMLFNLIYLAVFCLILVGTILAIFAAQKGLKLTGYLLMRIAIVLIFLTGIFVVVQMLLFFIVGGAISEVVCPAIRGLEVAPNTPLEIALARLQKQWILRKQEIRQDEGGGENKKYDMPNVGQILRSCKNDESAYQAFNLVTAFNITFIDDLVKEFNFNFNLPLTYSRNFTEEGRKQRSENGTAPGILQSADESKKQIINEVEVYSAFLKDAVYTKIGQCKPAYNAIDGTLNLFCHKVSGPIISFWFILQFIASVFLLIVVTVLVFERLHF